VSDGVGQSVAVSKRGGGLIVIAPGDEANLQLCVKLCLGEG
jgi:hypothetical protein